MQFWDRFVRAVYFGLAQHLPVGRDAALRVVDRALARGRLSLPGLGDTSLVLLLALLPSTSQHRAAVASLVTSRGLFASPVALLQLLQAVAPVRVTELIEVSRPPEWRLRQLVLDALCSPGRLGLIEGLCLYLGRHYLLDPAGTQLRTLAEGLTGPARQFTCTSTISVMLPPG